jgi:glutathione synthase/RimK-type ligase-like ATP-grasp enzyme
VNAGQAFLDSLIGERDMMVQQYMPSFDTPGERALVCVDKKWTHAVQKYPRFAGEDESVSEALEITADEEALARRAVSCVEGDLLYARVDVVQDDDGGLVVSELELMEPSLFLLQCPEALERLVRAMARLLDG